MPRLCAFSDQFLGAVDDSHPIFQPRQIDGGDCFAENPKMLLEEMERIAEELTGFIQRINKTNSEIMFEDGMTSMKALLLSRGT